jgi:predicted CopG family antitoxin
MKMINIPITKECWEQLTEIMKYSEFNSLNETILELIKVAKSVDDKEQ